MDVRTNLWRSDLEIEEKIFFFKFAMSVRKLYKSGL